MENEEQLVLIQSSRPTSTQSTPRREVQALPRSVQSSPGRPLNHDTFTLMRPTELALSPAAERFLGKRENLALRESHETRVPDDGAPRCLELTADARILGPELPTLREKLSKEQVLPQVSQNANDALCRKGVVPVVDEEARAYEAEQLRHWSSLHGEVALTADVAYEEREEEYDMEVWVMAAFDTSRYLGLPLATNDKAIAVPLKLLSPLPCIALLQTMLMEAGFEFLNVVLIWSDEVAGVPEELVYGGVEEGQHRIFEECVEWNKLMRGVNYHIRQQLDPLLEAMVVSDLNPR
ncbi:hypothetical protein PC117_g5317 [Phytophthora cactorum]|nr:hypothetical protein PC117_g5317 [Phytophthora cactorum]